MTSTFQYYYYYYYYYYFVLTSYKERLIVPLPSLRRTEEECEVPQWATVVQSRTEPSFRVAVFSFNDIVSSRILRNGVWERELIDLMHRRHTTGARAGRPFKRVVDVGANLGFFSLYAAALGAEVAAFEPMPDNVALLRASICLNGFGDRLHLFNTGLGRRAQRCVCLSGCGRSSSGGDLPEGHNIGDGIISCDPEEVYSKGNSDSGRRRHSSRHDVNVERLDCILSRSLRWDSGPRIDFLKADVEGFEQDALTGGLRAWIPSSSTGSGDNNNNNNNNDDDNGFSPTALFAPRFITSECNHKMALDRGQNTFFYASLARILGCRLTFGIEGEEGGGGFFSTLFQRLPFAEYFLLAFCGGMSVNLECG